MSTRTSVLPSAESPVPDPSLAAGWTPTCPGTEVQPSTEPAPRVISSITVFRPSSTVTKLYGSFAAVTPGPPCLGAVGGPPAARARVGAISPIPARKIIVARLITVLRDPPAWSYTYGGRCRVQGYGPVTTPQRSP